jgi:hypothetical protein
MGEEAFHDEQVGRVDRKRGRGSQFAPVSHAQAPVDRKAVTALKLLLQTPIQPPQKACASGLTA